MRLLGPVIYWAACLVSVACIAYGALFLVPIYQGETSDPGMYWRIAIEWLVAAIAIFAAGWAARELNRRTS